MVDERLSELGQLRMVMCAQTYHIDDFIARVAGGRMDNQEGSPVSLLESAQRYRVGPTFQTRDKCHMH